MTPSREKNEQAHDDRRDILDLIQSIRKRTGLPLRELQPDQHRRRGGQIRQVVRRFSQKREAARVRRHDKIQAEQEDVDQNRVEGDPLCRRWRLATITRREPCGPFHSHLSRAFPIIPMKARNA
jgi:hypothetical protein